jgi:hypothetical protein
MAEQGAAFGLSWPGPPRCEAGADREAALQAGLAVPTPRSLPVDPNESRRNAERQFEELVAC